jgi:hypothetical protein
MYYNKYNPITVDIDLLSLCGTFNKRYPGPTGGFLTYYWINDYVKLFKLFPDVSLLGPDFIFVAVINGGYSGPDGENDMGPHRDHNTSTVLNWYQTANDCITYFYEPKPKVIPFKSEIDTESNLYTLNDVEVVGEFQAKDNDLYLLNVSKIHSVKVTKPGPRVFLSMSWTTKSFEEVSEFIRLNTKWN